MKTFMGKNFLLSNDTAKALYHNYAEKLPIIDYHCHVSPREIAEDRRYDNIQELWLGGDHYKWRAIRTCGVPEKYITGDASAYEKFRAFATVMPKLIGNPLYHWSHLELKRYFGYEGVLNEYTCDEVWELCNEKLRCDPDMTVRGIIKSSNVEVICTTDDPCDTLEYHEALAADESFDVRVLPAWRPDKAVNIERAGYLEYLEKLGNAAGVEIDSLASFKEALEIRLNYFEDHGCITSDHAIDETIPFVLPTRPTQPAEIFERVLGGDTLSEEEVNIFKTEMYCFFGGEYKKRGWVMQIHFGVLRNVNTRMFEQLGPDTGFDIIGGRVSITELAKLINHFENNDSLPKLVLYSINPADNEGIGALIGAFQSFEGEEFCSHPRIMQGSAWWFNDNKTGMRDQMISLANLSALGCFLGMLTDSRSFISYTRHEYFRRIFCDLVGTWVENGEYPCDIDALAEIVMNVSYNNTKEFFGF